MPSNKKTLMADPFLRRRLTDAEVAYVFRHLGCLVSADVPLDGVIEWPRSDEPLRKDFMIDGIPVLFPSAGAPAVPFEVEGDRVVVRHDLVKSAFYLLSAYEEWATGRADEWGRFPYEGSLQDELGVARKPIVNYYFKWMTEAIARQCEMLGIRCSVLSPLGGPSLHLSHDVDQVRYFTWRKALFRCAQVAGLRRCDVSRRRMATAAARSLLQMAGLRHDADPYWSFDEILDNEAYVGYKSDWFFLPDDAGPFPPDYALADPDIAALMARLAGLGCNVGLHAPIRCREAGQYAAQFKALSDVCGHAARRVRQHFLAIRCPQSYVAMEAAGLEADFSYGMSHHEGFRNSYCLPFHPFDHDGKRPLELTVVPLAMMDVTVLRHRSLGYDDILFAVGEMLEEVRLFGGVFSLLWHNSTFDEVCYPGARRLYEDLHLFFSQYQLRQFVLSKF